MRYGDKGKDEEARRQRDAGNEKNTFTPTADFPIRLRCAQRLIPDAHFGILHRGRTFSDKPCRDAAPTLALAAC